MSTASVWQVDPDLFIRELQRGNVPVQVMGGLVANLGDEYVEKIDKQCEVKELFDKEI